MGKRDLTYYKKYQPKVDFIDEYARASNAASGSKYDANSNVETKNVTTLTGEIHKGDDIGINRLRMIQKITDMYGEDLAKEYIRQLEDHEIYRHDETHPVYPYTYSAKEALIVKIGGKTALCSFEDLYAMSEFEEYLCDEEKEVYCKYPNNIEIRDKDGKWTKITRLVKKRRHRDLVVCKTSNGESVIVTDNHPMIVSDDKNDTVEAICVEGKNQYRDNTAGSIVKINDKKTTIPIYHDEKCGGFGVVRTNNYIQYSNINATADWKFGYFVGFFIAEGWYHKSNSSKIDIYDGIILKQKTRPILDKVARYLYESTGIYSSILKTKDIKGNYALYVKSQSLVKMLLEDFKISPFAQEKKLPMTLFDYPKEFIYGLIGGIIDGDGTKRDNGEISIRLSSRTCISQIGAVLSVFDIPFFLTYYDPSGNISSSYIGENSYPVFGITFSCPKWLEGISEKYVNSDSRSTLYKRNVWERVETVKVISNKSFLVDNEFIYDVTTESNTFILNNIWVHNCVSVTLYPFILDGLSTIGAPSTAPKNLDSFVGNFINLVFAVAAQFAGAVATPEFLVYLDYFIRKEYGDDYYSHPDDVVDLSKRKRTIRRMICDKLEQVYYSLNEPAAARNFQSVFWNISYYDKTYFDAIFEDFVFPDGDEPKWESVSWLQKLAMKWLNRDRVRRNYFLTFPVETMNLVYDKETKEYKDPEWADFTAEMWAEGHSFFCYNSDSADSLSSCCFSKDTMTLTRDSNGVHVMSFEDLYKAKYKDAKRNLTIFHNGSWVGGKVIKLQNRKMFKITTSNNKEIVVSDNHLSPTLRGDIRTDELTTEDYLLFNTRELNTFPEKDRHLTYEQGFVIGAFLGDGSFGTTMHLKSGENVIYDTNFSQNKDKYTKCIEMVNKACEQLGIDSVCSISEVHNNVYPVRISSRDLVDFISYWTNWERGVNAYTKELNMDCLMQSVEFRRGILDGWYNTDGGNSNRCYTVSKKLANCMEVLITSLGMQSIITETDRRDEPCVIRGRDFSRHGVMYTVRWYDMKNKRSMGDVYKIVNNSVYFRITSIEEVDYNDDIYCFEMKNQDEPYFTLPNGIITHNCRLKNGITENVFSFTLGAGGISTGSKAVITTNINRLVQNAVRDGADISERVREQAKKNQKYLLAFNEILKDELKAGLLPIYNAGYISLEKQYLTQGM